MHSKITPDHLARQAIVYVRQSTLKQVLENTESTERQYALVDKAIVLGWPRAQVIVIDEDQGHSAVTAVGRSGFQQLVSAIGLGQIGIVLALEISRFARSQSDWYHVLELAAIFHTLIADEDGVYDPQDHNDRLLLGLKGTISEAELWSIRARLQGGKWNKARKGELAWSLPIGLVREPDGRVRFDPDQQVQTTIRTILTQFRTLGSASAVLRYFRQQDLRVPRSVLGADGPAHVIWKTPTYEAIYLILTNPTYAGAYAYGRRKSVPADQTHTVPARRRTPQEEWTVLIPEVFPAYLSWTEYLENQTRLATNRSRFMPGPGAVRQGEALLTGLVVCARCGRHLATIYNTDPWYTCLRAKRRYGEPQCQSCKAAPIDRAVTELFLQATQPAQVEAALQALDQLEQERQHLDQLWQQRVERARYEAERAQRQFDRVEPEHRLVARELENRWNVALAEVQRLERSYAQAQQEQLAPLTENDRLLIRRSLTELPQLWYAETTTMADRKRLIRCLIREVALDGISEPGTIIVHVCWHTGATTTVRVRRPRSTDGLTTDAAILEQMRALAPTHSDDQIAEVLNAQHFTTRWGKPWTYQRVHNLRVRNHIPSACPIVPRGQDTRGDGLISVSAAAHLLGVSRATIDGWVRHGILFAQQMPGKNPYWLRVSPDDMARLTAQSPEPGFERLRAATKTLGRTEAQLWEEVRAGRRAIRRMRREQHWEWQVDVSAAENQYVLQNQQRGTPASAITLYPTTLEEQYE
ncbi:MAG: recombinase family protein [Chloroflexi bacterium]|nr:recombinase family protein [Chloroflexota bacterium]